MAQATLAIGFVPAVILSWVFELTPQGLKREDDVAPEQSITPQTGRRMDRKVDPLFDPLRGEPRFQQLVARLFSRSP
jgi:hypothetical protein